jgi:hypothetical protein
VEIPAAEGRPAFRHTFAPRTLREQALAAAILVVSLVRAPALQVVSALAPRADGESFASLTMLDPLPGEAGMWWVLALNLALGGVLAFLCWLRLRKLGAARGHRLFWIITVALLGLLGFLCYRLLETRRAWRPLPAAEPAPPLLIATA